MAESWDIHGRTDRLLVKGLETAMDRNYIDRHLVIDRYLQGTLAEGEKAEFEERLIWDHELIDELDLAERLRDGLVESIKEDKYTASYGQAGVVGRLSGLLSVPQYAAAASFVLAVTLTAGVLLNPFGPDSDLQGNQAVPTEIVPLLVVRGADVQTIIVNENAWTVLLVDVLGAYDSYRVTVRKDESGADPIWMQDELLPTYPEALAVGMPGSVLAAGRYVLSLEGVRESGTGEKTYEHVQDIPFETSPTG
jgi:hypothetical protein